jgi:hypothetical protein
VDFVARWMIRAAESVRKHREGSMAEIGKFSLTVDHEALRKIVGEGRLLELANALAEEARAQISAQLVEKLASAAVNGAKLENGVTVEAHYIFEGGDFGTRPPRPHWGVGSVSQPGALGGALQRLAVAAEKLD